MLLPGSAVVVYGGGAANGRAEPRCTAQVAANEDSGLALGLALNNDGDTVQLLSPGGQYRRFAVAAIARACPQRIRWSNGARKMPPPIPASPER